MKAKMTLAFIAVLATGCLNEDDFEADFEVAYCDNVFSDTCEGFEEGDSCDWRAQLQTLGANDSDCRFRGANAQQCIDDLEDADECDALPSSCDDVYVNCD